MFLIFVDELTRSQDSSRMLNGKLMLNSTRNSDVRKCLTTKGAGHCWNTAMYNL